MPPTATRASVQAALNAGANAGLINAINNNTNAQIAALQANRSRRCKPA
jgi:hypothetical protein